MDWTNFFTDIFFVWPTPVPCHATFEKSILNNFQWKHILAVNNFLKIVVFLIENLFELLALVSKIMRPAFSVLIKAKSWKSETNVLNTTPPQL